MHRGSNRRVLAAGMLAVFLLLAVPQTVEARVLEPAQHEQVASRVEPQREAALWERMWSLFSSTWAKVSVLIEPGG